jgi:hypothetical protein
MGLMLMNCRLQVAQQAVQLRPLTVPEAGEEINDPLLMLARHAMKAAAASGRESHTKRAAVLWVCMTLHEFFALKLVHQGRHIAAADHHSACQLAHGESFAVPLKLRQEIESGQGDIKMFPQTLPNLTFNQ